MIKHSLSLQLSIEHERFAVAGSFTIARGSRTHIDVLTLRLSDGDVHAQAECVPYGRYSETVESVKNQLLSVQDAFLKNPEQEAVQALLSPGAARNGLDCVLWDYRAKRAGQPVADLLGIKNLKPLISCYTLSLSSPEAMLVAAQRAAHYPVLKVKLGQAGDCERIRAVREGAPHARLVLDANEGWQVGELDNLISVAEACGVDLIEQPLPAGQDDILKALSSPVPLCADESFHTAKDLDQMAERYSAVNIKLDKTGGLSEALKVMEAVRQREMKVMVGCMLGTSLAMAPAYYCAQQADFVDLDGPLLLAEDRAYPISYQGSTMFQPSENLWG
jgi:L-alanine-DL-glutamate epimerase-like enolase superfamily enzyme